MSIFQISTEFIAPQIGISVADCSLRKQRENQMYRFITSAIVELYSLSAFTMFCPIQEGAFQQNGHTYTYKNSGTVGDNGEAQPQPNYFLHTNDPGHPCDSVLVEFECEVSTPDGFSRRIPLQSIVPASSNRPGPTCGQMNVNYDDACYFGSQAIFADLTHESSCQDYVVERMQSGQMAPGGQTE
jgi:hypothetical protein